MNATDMHKRGALFVFEGPDGVGKTTISHAFSEHLNSTGVICDYFSFPGKIRGTLGKYIYDIHHNMNGIELEAIDPTSLQLLHVAAHIDLIETRIKPSLNRGRCVVLDRFWWSTLVYGILSEANKRSLQTMIKLESLHWDEICPSIVFLISRKEPIDEDLTVQWKRLAEEYNKLAISEESNYTVRHIKNEQTAADALMDIIQHANFELNAAQREK